MFNPKALYHVTLDVHAKDVSGMSANLVSIIGQFDATSLTATTNLHLCFHDDGIARSLSRGDRLIDSVSFVTRAYRDVKASKVLLALVFEQVH
jgi:hypothetical protein